MPKDVAHKRYIERKARIAKENAEQAEIINRHRIEAQEKRKSNLPLFDTYEEGCSGNVLRAIAISEGKFEELDPSARRRVLKKKGTVSWSDEEKINAIYAECARLNENEAEDPYAVDHYYPIQGKTVSGLHVPENLRIIRRSENSKKSNKHPEDFESL